MFFINVRNHLIYVVQLRSNLAFKNVHRYVYSATLTVIKPHNAQINPSEESGHEL